MLKENLPSVFEALKAVMKTCEPDLVLKYEEPGKYHLDTHHVRADGYVMAFGRVEIRKNYVSYHLMPIYAHPELLSGISATLQKRMQGKSCFNFTKIEPDTLKELEALTLRGCAAFVKGDPRSAAEASQHRLAPDEAATHYESDFPKISKPALRALTGAGYLRLEHLTHVSKTELSKLHGMGPKALGALEKALEDKGLSFKTSRIVGTFL